MALRLAIDDPVGVENLMPTVFGVSLGKHHQFNVAGVTSQLIERIDKIIDFIFCQRQPQRLVGGCQRLSATP